MFRRRGVGIYVRRRGEGSGESEETNFPQFCCDADADCASGGMGKCEHNNATMHGVVGVGVASRRKRQQRGRDVSGGCQFSGRCFGRVRQHAQRGNTPKRGARQ
jgi:hypothetical protein